MMIIMIVMIYEMIIVINILYLNVLESSCLIIDLYLQNLSISPYFISNPNWLICSSALNYISFSSVNF